MLVLDRARRWNTRTSGAASAEVLLQDPVEMVEHRVYEPPSNERGKPRLEGEPIGKQRARADSLEEPLVTPQLHAEHRRLLKEAFAGLKTKKREIAAVDW